MTFRSLPRWPAAVLLLGLATASADAQARDAPPTFGREQLEASLAAGSRQLESSQFASARQSFEEAICWAAELSDGPALAKAWAGLARTQWSAGENSRSLESDERALELRSRLSDPELLALALNNVGLDLYSTGRHAEALDYYVRGLGQAVTPSTRALLLLNIGLIFRYQARFEDAETMLREALAIRRAGDNPRQTALVLNALGLLGRVTGRYADALRDHGDALDLRRQQKDRFGEAQSLNNLANTYGSQGEMEKALEMHRAALRIAQEIGYTRQIGLSHENIGAELDDLGRPKEALQEAREAIALYRKTDDRSNLANTLSNAGGYLVELRELEEARTVLSEALTLARAIGEPEMEIVSLQGLAEADLADGKAPEALARLDTALPITQKSGFTGHEWKVRFDRARAVLALGRQEESLAELRAAVETINTLRTQIGTDAGKIGFLDSCQEVFDMLTTGLFAASRPGEALETAEAGRARALADLLSQRQMQGKPADRVALAEIRGAQARARGARPEAAARSGERARGAEVGEAVARLRSLNPELASLMAVDSPKLDEIQQTARRLGATFIEYLSAQDACYIWVVAPAGDLQALRRDVARDKLADMIRAVREGFESADLRRPLARSLAGQLQELDALLIAPLERWLPSSPDELVVIVPHGPLALLPFSALIDSNGRTLLSRHTLVFAPAVSSFRYTAEKGRAQTGTRAPALVVADPVPPKGSGLPALPGARAEAESVARRLGRGTTLLSGRRATEAAVKREAPGRAILHFATHGLISEARPLASSLYLGEGDGEDGYLRVDEIFGLDLHADLVVLSGCRTGLGRLSGDGILGLTRAFLYAGTPSIVVSQWDVSDRATAFVMDRFYAGLVAGRGKAQALRTAQLEARRRFPHPAAWSAFVLVGEPR